MTNGDEHESMLCLFTYVDGCYGDHVGAVKLQPHLLHGLPELSAVLRALPVHLQDIQAGGEHLGLALDSTEPQTHTFTELFPTTTMICMVAT